MPKTAVQTPICDICGADVREGSLFCYNCGGSLKRAGTETAPKPPTATPAVKSNGKVKTAPEEKRPARRRNVDRGPVEVVWIPREGFPVVYVIAGAVLLMIALFLFIAAMWLK